MLSLVSLIIVAGFVMYAALYALGVVMTFMANTWVGNEVVYCMAMVMFLLVAFVVYIYVPSKDREQNRKQHCHEIILLLHANKSTNDSATANSCGADFVSVESSIVKADDHEINEQHAQKEDSIMNQNNIISIQINRAMSLKRRFNRAAADKAAKPTDKNVNVRVIMLVPRMVSGKLDYRALLYTGSASNNPIMKNFIEHNDGELPLITGNYFVNTANTYSKDIVFLDYSALARADYIGGNYTASVLKDELVIGEHNGLPAIFAYDPFWKAYQVITDFGNNPVFVKRDNIVNTLTGSLKPGFERFAASENALNSASQGRQQSIALFANTTPVQKAKAERVINAANIGQVDQLNASLKTMSEEVLADVVNRLGSKFTRMNTSGADKLRSIIIDFSKDDNYDGMMLVNENYVERVLGSGNHVGGAYQMRPFTAKVDGVIKSGQYMARFEECHQLKALSIYADKVTFAQQLAFNIVMNKALRKAAGINLKTGKNMPSEFAGYNAVRIIYQDGPVGAADMIGNLNAFKDTWTLSKRSGINTMAIAHYDGRKDFCDVYTNSQLWRVIGRAVNIDSDEDNKELADKLREKLFTRELNDNLSLEQKSGEFHGEEKLDSNYFAGVAQLLNKNAWAKYPSVFRKVLQDCVARIEETINRDRYRHEGHNAVLTVDAAYVLTSQHLLNVTDEYIEVFDPVFERYARKNDVNRCGFIQKVPCMGTCEGLKAKFVSYQEMNSRINDLDINDELKHIVWDDVLSTHEGIIMFPASIDVIAGTAAGLDYDFDKGIVFFPTSDNISIPSVIWNSNWKMHWVNIETNSKTSNSDVMAELGNSVTTSIFANYASRLIQFGNKTVGEVTNGFDILTMPAWNKHTKALEVFSGMLYKAGFGLGTAGKGKYKSQVTIDAIEIADGIKVNRYNACVDLYNRIKNTAAKSAINWENIYIMANDLDVLARAAQEMTIDAQKKFYKVVCDYLDKIHDFSNLRLTGIIKFNVNYANDPKQDLVALCSEHGTLGKDAKLPVPCAYYKETKKGVEIANNNRMLKKEFSGKDGMLFSMTTKYSTKYIIADDCADMRASAATYAIAKLRELAAEYVKTIEAYKLSAAQNTAIQTSLYKMTPAHVLVQLKNATGLVYTVSSMWSEQQAVMREKFAKNGLYSYMNKAERLKAEQDIKAYVNQQLNDLIAYADNNVRQIVAENINIYREQGLDRDFTIEDAILLMADKRISTSSYELEGIFGRCLRPETLRMMASKAEQSFVTVDVEDELDELQDGQTVNVSDNTVVNTNIAVNVVSGPYIVNKDENGTFLSRPIEDFIDVPEIDNSKMAFKYFTKKDEIIKALKNIKAGSEIHIALKNMHSSHCHFELTANGEVIDIAISEIIKESMKENKEIRKNAFEANLKAWKRFDGVTATFAGFINQAKNDLGYANFVILLNDIH